MASPRNTGIRVMADRSNFWQMVDRTKPSKLRVFGDDDLDDCLNYFSEIQFDSTLPPNESLTASERLTLIRSELDLRHAEARYKRTQRLARWAIVIGMMSIVVAISSAVVQYFVHKPLADRGTATTETAISAMSTPIVLATPVEALVPTTPSETPDLTPAPTVPAATPKPMPTDQRRKKPRTKPESKTKAAPDKSIDQILRSLVRPKPTPKPNRR